MTKILSLLLLLQSITLTYSKCFEHPKPFQKGFMEEVPCEYGEYTLTNIMPKLVASGSNLTTSENSQNMFQISLSCQASQSICSKVNTTFQTAGLYLSNIIKFKVPVTVQASYYSFCRTSGDCSTSQITLGQAAAARSVALKDDDGQERLYPQSLIKQMKLSPMPKVSSYDIIAEFNSDANFWFDGSAPIAKNQVDFLLVVSHELVHGLGFASAYNDYFNDDAAQSLTPNPELGRTSSGQLALTGFYENVFDRYINMLGTSGSLSNYTKQFNDFVSSKTLYRNTQDLASSFKNSDQYTLGQKLLQIASTPGSMGFNIGKNTATVSNGTLLLETSLSPFAVGSSISHVAYKSYSNTEEFLMRFELAPGVSLSSAVNALGTWGSEPYGPALVEVFSRMGYPTNDNPNPIVKVSNPGASSGTVTSFSSFLLIIVSIMLHLF